MRFMLRMDWENLVSYDDNPVKNPLSIPTFSITGDDVEKAFEVATTGGVKFPEVSLFSYLEDNFNISITEFVK